MIKICRKCRIEKDISEFYIKGNGKPHSYCHKCRLQGHKDWRMTHLREIEIYKEKTKDYRKIKEREYREKNREKLRLVSRKYNIICREKRKEYYKNRKEKTRETHKRWREKNRDKYNKYYIEYLNKNINNRIAHRLRTRIRKALFGVTKHFTLKEVLGCTLEELKHHLESQFIDNMSWSNYGQAKDKWNIDHIRSLKSFPDLSNPEQQKEAFCYKNLQPMWNNDNISKGAKYNGIDYRNKKSQ